MSGARSLTYNFMHPFTLIRLWPNHSFLHTSCLSFLLNALSIFFQSSLYKVTLCVRTLFTWPQPSTCLSHVGLASHISCITPDFLRDFHEWLSEHTCFIHQPHLPRCLLRNLHEIDFVLKSEWNIWLAFVSVPVDTLTAQLRLFEYLS